MVVSFPYTTTVGANEAGRLGTLILGPDGRAVGWKAGLRAAEEEAARLNEQHRVARLRAEVARKLVGCDDLRRLAAAVAALSGGF